MLLRATARAIPLAGQHPAVVAWRIVSTREDGVVVAAFDLRTELPAAWRPAGESPSGVRALETVTLTFPPGFPAQPPRIALRQDFSRWHPHLNPGPADEPPVPCIVEGSPAELLQARGILGYIDQLASWLDAAAMLALNDRAQGWEPVRRDDLDDVMVVDGERLRTMATDTAGCAVVQTRFILHGNAGEEFYLLDHRSCAPTDLKLDKTGREQIREGVWRGQGLGLLLWAGTDANGASIIAADYLPETVVTVGDLRERAASYRCLEQLDAKLNHLFFALDGRVILPFPLTVTFLVRRPFNLVGSDSPVELCAYLIALQPSQKLADKDQSLVRYAGLREQLSVPLLRRASAEAPSGERSPWTMIGCGSLGSKIAITLARRGRGPSLVIDGAAMMPHNYARHALLPDQLERLGLTRSKATLLAEALAGLQQPAAEHVGDVVALAADAAGRERLVGANGRLLLNTTGLSYLREALAFLPWERRPWLGEAYLLGAGQVAYAAFEGADGNPNLSDLAAESYHRLGESALAAQVFGAAAEAVAIGQGCGAVTFPMPDSRIGALAAGLAEVVARREAAGGAGGAFYIGSLAADGLSQSWEQAHIAPWRMVAAEGLTVRISPRAQVKIETAIAAAPGIETGGVLIGRFSQTGNAFQIVDVLPAPPDSVFSPEKFVLGTIGLKAALTKVIGGTAGALYALGTWHNHLVASGPSALDASTAARLALRQFFPVLMLIALPAGYTCLTAERFDAGLFEAAMDPPLGSMSGGPETDG